MEVGWVAVEREEEAPVAVARVEAAVVAAAKEEVASGRHLADTAAVSWAAMTATGTGGAARAAVVREAEAAGVGAAASSAGESTPAAPPPPFRSCARAAARCQRGSRRPLWSS